MFTGLTLVVRKTETTMTQNDQTSRSVEWFLKSNGKRKGEKQKEKDIQ